MGHVLKQKRDGGKKLKEGPGESTGALAGSTRICKASEESVKGWDFILRTMMIS